MFMERNDSWMFYKGSPIKFEVPEGVQLPIYVIGDSHVRVLPECAPDIFSNSQADINNVFESKTAYAIGNEGHNLYLKGCLRIIPDGALALISFGEIDCRHYVPVRAIENKTSIEEEVDKVIKSYTENCVRLLKEKFKIIMLGAYVCPEDHNHSNLFIDIFKAKTLFNQKIKKYCKDNNILFIPIFWKALEENWDEQEQGTYFNDSSHLGPCMVPEILKPIPDFKWD